MRTLLICIFSIFIMSYDLPTSFAASELEDKQLFEATLKRANGGEVDAQLELGNLYIQGKGVSKDYQKAKEWYEKAAKQGHAIAQYNLSILFITGQGIQKDYQKAREWLEKAAQQGYAEAQYRLGSMYVDGEYVRQDYQ